MELEPRPQETTSDQSPHYPIKIQALNQKGIVIPILVTIITLIILGTGGYYLYQKQTNSTTSSQRASQPTPSQTSDETTNWKFYTNSDGRYSIKYPNNFQYIERAPSVMEGTAKKIPKYIYGETYTRFSTVNTSNTSSFYFLINHYSVSSPSTLDEFITNEGSCIKKLAENDKSLIAKKIKLDSKEALVYEDLNHEKCGIYDWNLTNIYTINGDKAYLIQITHKLPYLEIQKDVDQILSTFKFTDSATNDIQREKALEFLKAHPSIHDIVYTKNRESVEIYRSIPQGKALDHEWYRSHSSTTIKGTNGNDIVSWQGLPSCESKQDKPYELYDEEGNRCWRVLGISVLFDDNGSPTSVFVTDMGGIP